MPEWTSCAQDRLGFGLAEPKRASAALNLSFTIEPATTFDEASVPVTTPEEWVKALASGKALDVAHASPGRFGDRGRHRWCSSKGRLWASPAIPTRLGGCSKGSRDARIAWSRA